MKILLYVLVALVIILLFIILESMREINSVKKKSYRLSFPKYKGSLRIAFISDYHCANNGKNNRKIEALIKGEKPDMIISAGDMVIGNSDMYELKATAIDLLNNLSDIAPLYMSNGNHELKLRRYNPGVRDEYLNALSDKITWLNNKTFDFDENITIFGFDEDDSYYSRFERKKMETSYLEESFGKKPDQLKLNIMIAHDPEYFPTYADYGVDLVLSGHYHGGLVRLPLLGGVISPRFRLFPKYDYGEFISNDTHMILTNGLGSHSIKLRLFNTPEVVIVEINK